jgi:hypothetical protein
MRYEFRDKCFSLLFEIVNKDALDRFVKDILAFKCILDIAHILLACPLFQLKDLRVQDVDVLVILAKSYLVLDGLYPLFIVILTLGSDHVFPGLSLDFNRVLEK